MGVFDFLRNDILFKPLSNVVGLVNFVLRIGELLDEFGHCPVVVELHHAEQLLRVKALADPAAYPSSFLMMHTMFASCGINSFLRVTFLSYSFS